MSKKTFLFYDLETSGVNSRTARIMQFAGQRTDINLKKIGEPYNFLIKLSDDVLAEPDAVLITGITPQKTWAEGITEEKFCRIFENEISTPDTIFVGFNNIRFDDEFMRFLFWRNFRDSYQWQWKDGRSRWDLLDVARMTRALRPEGIEWPLDSSGKASNRLELLTSVNKLSHKDAHDALSDVDATIAVAALIKNKQSKLFEYLLKMRDKKEVKKLVNSGQPFLYSSGKYSSENEKTTVVSTITPHPDGQGVLVYDLRHDPTQFFGMKAEELAQVWRYNKDPEAIRLPIKSLKFNRCPAISPLGVLDEKSQKRLSVDMKLIEGNRKKLSGQEEFVNKLFQALEILNKDRNQEQLFVDSNSVDTQLYEGFVDGTDRGNATRLTQSPPDKLSAFKTVFSDKRLKTLIPLYKARNFPKYMSTEEKQTWERHCQISINKKLPEIIARMKELTKTNPTKEKKYILDEMQLYLESIVPSQD